MASGTIPRPAVGHVNFVGNGTYTVPLGIGAYLITMYRPNRPYAEIFFARNGSTTQYIDSIAAMGTPSAAWDTITFAADGTLSFKVKDGYCNLSWVKLL